MQAGAHHRLLLKAGLQLFRGRAVDDRRQVDDPHLGRCHLHRRYHQLRKLKNIIFTVTVCFYCFDNENQQFNMVVKDLP